MSEPAGGSFADRMAKRSLEALEQKYPGATTGGPVTDQPKESSV